MVRLLLPILLTLVFGGAGLHAQAVLSPPFGLKWGDSPGALIDWAGKHRLDVEIRLPGKEPDLRIVRVSPDTGRLPSSQARAIEGRFIAGRLFEVSVHYGAPEDPAAEVEALFNEVRKALTREHGALSPNRQEKSVENQVATRTLSFHREPVRGVFLLLAHTEVEDLLRKRKEATFSLLYRNDNLKQQVEASPEINR